jgi:signal transduction histidine kinase
MIETKAPARAGVIGETGDIVGRHLSRIDELQARVAELERANRELAAFAADAAHDLRTPLQAVTGFAELLARREGPRLDETSQGFVAHILNAAGAMRELVEAVLEHRQSSAGPLTVAPIDCNDLLTGVLHRFHAELDETGAQVRVDELPRISGDRVQLGRVFQNLIANALRATPPDRRPSIAVTARRLPAAWELSVTDDGVGVPAEDRHRIFELFQRSSAGNGTGPGHGMGLGICRTIVERHGGRIGVEKAPGGGSRFSFTVPDALSPSAV